MKIEELRLTDDYVKELIGFAKNYYSKENNEKKWLTVSIFPYPMIGVDEVTKLSKSLFGKIPSNSYCRQFVFKNVEWEERSLDEIKKGDPDDIDMIFVMKIDNSFNGADHFRIVDEGAKIIKDGAEKGKMIADSCEIDAEWDGQKMVLLPETKRLKYMA